MQPRFRIIFTYSTITAIVILLVFALPARTAQKTEATDACCKKTEGTCAEPGKGPTDDLMLENLSRQFILVSPVN
jgi:hypothetical protein